MRICSRPCLAAPCWACPLTWKMPGKAERVERWAPIQSSVHHGNARRYTRVCHARLPAPPPPTRSCSRAMSTAAAPALPSLLPQKRTHLELEAASATQWKPTRYLEPPQPPPQDDAKQREIEMATARQLMDGKALKRIRPRRTVDYGGSMGRWELVRDESQRPRTGIDDLHPASKTSSEPDVCALHATCHSLCH
jgi:hypothetical protein